MLYNTDGCHGKFLKYQIQVKNEIVLIPPISGSLWQHRVRGQQMDKQTGQAKQNQVLLAW